MRAGCVSLGSFTPRSSPKPRMQRSARSSFMFPIGLMSVSDWLPTTHQALWWEHVSRLKDHNDLATLIVTIICDDDYQ